MVNIGLAVLIVSGVVFALFVALVIFMARLHDKHMIEGEQDANKYGYSTYECKYQVIRNNGLIECACNRDGFLHVKRIARIFANIDGYYHYHFNGLGYTFYNLMEGKDDSRRIPPELELWGFKDFYRKLHLAMEYYIRSYRKNRDIDPVFINNIGNLYGFKIWINENM